MKLDADFLGNCKAAPVLSEMIYARPHMKDRQSRLPQGWPGGGAGRTIVVRAIRRIQEKYP